MVNSVKLKNIYLGHLDGEIESTRDNFEQLFYNKNSKFEQIMNYDRFIISGRKGTGKTLLSKYIHKKLTNEKNVLCKIFTRRDFKLQQLLDMDYRTLQLDEISLFWKWTFLIQIGRSILELDKIHHKIPFTPERKLKQFFSDKYQNNIFKLIEFQTSYQTKNNAEFNTNLAKTNVESSHQTNNSFIKAEYYDLLNPLEDLILKCLKRNREFVLIYDDLDELEDKMSEDSNYYPLLFSMLNIIKDINLMLRSIGKKKSKIIVCLRSDIIDDIHKYSSNSNKLTSDNKVDLYWIRKNYENPEDHPLMEMILLKIKYSVPEYSKLDKSSLYKKIFPKKIQNHEVIDYLINFSFGRPRDIISYLNIIMKNYPESTHFEPRYFSDCAKEYSKWFHNELENEISISPMKEMLIDSVRLINDFKKRTFHFEEICEFFSEHKQNYPNISDIKKSIRYLYKYGVIGNSWVHSRKKGKKIYHYSWGYRNDANTEPTYTQTFVIHYGLRKHFSL